MRYSQLFGKTNKNAKEYDSINATYLIRGGFIDQTMAGVYTYLPLGLRVLTKIENIIREEMDKIGNELVMPALSPTDLWVQSKRLETIDVLFKVEGANNPSREKNDATYILNPTHEDILTPIAKKFNTSYKDLPFAVYQIQSKFRNEARPKSGIMRGREFRMKDLYSFHTSEEGLKTYYEKSKETYTKVFERLGLGHLTVIALASGGDFTKDYSHEFQTKCETGEDEIYYIKSENTYYNKEVAPLDGLNEEDYEVFKAAEVGNIFPLNTKFSDAFEYKYTDENGEQKPVYMGSYGIGSTRVMGVIVEVSHDEKGIIWPENIAPYQVHLLGLNLEDNEVAKKAVSLYEKLLDLGVEVLFDDRESTSSGEKFADADIIGCPYRVVISKRTEENVEFKKRNESDSQIISIEELNKKLSATK
jgi:prolyl-tRNA synthetase